MIMICNVCHEPVSLAVNKNGSIKPNQSCHHCGNNDFKIPKEHICGHCHGDIRLRNPTGKCDHLHYPENCEVCKEKMR